MTARSKKGAATAAPAPRQTRKVRIRILPHRAVQVEGTMRYEDAEFAVAPADAETLIAEGYAEPASKPKREPEPDPIHDDTGGGRRKPLLVAHALESQDWGGYGPTREERG